MKVTRKGRCEKSRVSVATNPSPRYHSFSSSWSAMTPILTVWQSSFPASDST